MIKTSESFKTVYLVNTEDRIGNLYPVVKITEKTLEPFLEELKNILDDCFDEYSGKQKERDRDTYHMTFLSVAEYEKIKKEGANVPYSNEYQIRLVGLGTACKDDKQAWFVVVESPQLNKLREAYGLPPKDFHITLAFKSKDVFGVRKDYTTLI